MEQSSGDFLYEVKVMSDIIYLIITVFWVGVIARGIMLLISNYSEIKEDIKNRAKKADVLFLKRLKILAVSIWVIISVYAAYLVSDYESSFNTFIYFIILVIPIISIKTIKWLFATNNLTQKFYFVYFFILILIGIFLISNGYSLYELYGTALLYSLIPLVFIIVMERISSHVKND